MDPRRSYLMRIHRVCDHIDAHLAEPLDLQALAAVANFSPWHFHRVFQAMTGETLAERVRRRRLEVAAARLLASPPQAASAIAFDVGFGSAAVFSRAFRAYFGVTPTAWREGAATEWQARQRARFSKIHQALRNPHQGGEALRGDDTGLLNPYQGTAMNVEIRTFPDTRVAFLRHVGPYGSPTIGQTWSRLYAWAGAHGLMQPRRKTYGISLDNPDITPPEQLRYDACIAVDANFRAQGEIGAQTIPGGRYACTEFNGTPDDFHGAWAAFFGGWLPDSGFECDDRPSFELYPEDFEPDPQTCTFRCWLCMPVRAV